MPRRRDLDDFADVSDDLRVQGPAVLIDGPQKPVELEKAERKEADQEEGGQKFRTTWAEKRALCQRIAWYRFSGRTIKETARLCGVSPATVNTYCQYLWYEEYMEQLQQKHEEQVQLAQELLAQRQLEYLDRAHYLATEEGIPYGVQADMLKTLMDRSDAIPLKRHTEQGSNEHGVFLPNESLKLIGETIAQGISAPKQEQAIDVQSVRVELPDPEKAS